MVFSSLVFLCIFLPAVWLVQLLLPSVKCKNAALLIASILFYAYGEPVYVILLLFSALINWALALWIAGSRRNRPSSGLSEPGQTVLYTEHKTGKGFLVFSVILNIGFLVVFKYAGFLTQMINVLLRLHLPVPQIPLPIGISFYTFQALSYVIDVYRGSCDVQRNFFTLLLYISFFPQLIAGPIVKYRDIEKELRDRVVTAKESAGGIRRFLCGLSKKVLIANTCGVIVDTLFQAPPDLIWLPSAWLAAVAYLLQIYFDFSGYSDMAIGMGRMFGFHFRENFRYPYVASSITDFWRRWHISLSTWFREYLYIPLGGNRKSRARTIFNRFVVFLTCGIWHGANLTFLFWGFYHGTLLMAEDLVRTCVRTRGKAPIAREIRSVKPGQCTANKDVKKHVGLSGILKKVFLHGYTILAVTVGFVFFRADTIRQGFGMVSKMFTAYRLPSAESSVLLRSVLTPVSITALVAGAVASMPLYALMREKKWVQAASYAASLALMAVCILNLASGTYNPFIYFRF